MDPSSEAFRLEDVREEDRRAVIGTLDGSDHTHTEDVQDQEADPLPPALTIDPSSKAFRLEDVREGDRRAAIIGTWDLSMAASVNAEWQNLVSSSIVRSKASLLSSLWECSFALELS